jgi:hypothetical protein
MINQTKNYNLGIDRNQNENHMILMYCHPLDIWVHFS